MPKGTEFPLPLIGTYTKYTPGTNLRGVRVDDDGYLIVVGAGGLPTQVDVRRWGGVAVATHTDSGATAFVPVGGLGQNGVAVEDWPVIIGAEATTTTPVAVANGQAGRLTCDLNRRLRTLPEGATADNAVDTAALNPLKIGAIATQVPALATDTYMVNLTTDLYRQLRVINAGYTTLLNAIRVSVLNTIADDRDVAPSIWANSTNHGTAVGVHYPSDAGIEIGNRKHLTIQIDSTDCTTTFEGSNDGTTWTDITASVLDLNSFATGAANFAAGNWLLTLSSGLGCRYIRAAVTYPNPSNALLIQVMQDCIP